MSAQRLSVSRSLRWLFIVGVLGLAGAAVVLSPATAQESQQDTSANQHLRQARALSEAFKYVAQEVAPSVVNIRSTQVFDQRGSDDAEAGQPDPLQEEFFRRFFEDLPEGFRFRVPQMPRERTGEGSGVIAREDGYIITNFHVVHEADSIQVQLADDREYEATVVGTDSESDLAVIKIEANGLKPARLGDSDALEVGEIVLAIGSPFGFRQTVTSGIVSAKGRQLGIIPDASGRFIGFEDFIQTDAAINPGNSGGPLVNLNCEVIGINTAISTRTGGYQGVGFAIPSHMVKVVFESILESGKVERGWLGVSIRNLAKEFASERGYEGAGVFIADVLPDGPASQAGIKAGDIVTKINGQAMTTTTHLLNSIAETPPGDTVEIEVFRFGETKKFEVTLGDRSDQMPSQVTRSPTGESPAKGLGLSVQPLTPERARELGAEGRTGVVVARVQDGTPAARMGIRAGDIISMIGDQEIESVDDFTQAVEEADLSQGVSMQVIRNGLATFLFIKVEGR